MGRVSDGSMGYDRCVGDVGGCVGNVGGSVGYVGGSVSDDGCVSYDWGMGYDGDLGGDRVADGVLVDYGVETIDGVGGVVHGSAAAVGLGEAVATLDYVALSGFVLGLGVSGGGVVDVVGVVVGGVGVVVRVGDDGSVVGHRLDRGVDGGGGGQHHGEH